jgi:hypothetical protein
VFKASAYAERMVQEDVDGRVLLLGEEVTKLGMSLGHRTRSAAAGLTDPAYVAEESEGGGLERPKVVETERGCATVT